MEKEIIGKFFGSGKSKSNEGKSWVAVESNGERVFFSHWGELPLEIKKLKRGEEVKATYEEKTAKRGERTFINRILKSIEPTKAGDKANNEDKYPRYREYQLNLLKECYEDAKQITGNDDEAKEIALTLFDKRCTPLAYYG
jgi:hypothetical protein